MAATPGKRVAWPSCLGKVVPTIRNCHPNWKRGRNSYTMTEIGKLGPLLLRTLLKLILRLAK